MSNRRHSLASEVAHLLAEIKKLNDPAKIDEEYGITIRENQSVYDRIDKITFPNLRSWATAIVEQDYADEEQYSKYDNGDDERD